MTKRTGIVANQVRAADLMPASMDAERRTVDVVFTTGAAVKRYDWWADRHYLEELEVTPEAVRLDRLNGGAPFLRDHYASTDSTIGVVERGSAKIENGRGTATVRFPPAGVDENADKIFEKIRAGVLTSVSVGYRTHAVIETRSTDGGLDVIRSTDWEPYEISAVAMPADTGAQFRSAQPDIVVPTIHPNGERMPEPIVPVPAPPAPVVPPVATEDLVRAERARISGINHAVRVANLGTEFAQRMIDAGTALDVARTEVLAELERRSAPPGPTHLPITGGETSGEKFIRGATAALLERAGLTRDVEAAKATKKVKGLEKVDTDGGEFRGMSFLDMARHVLTALGVSTRGLSPDEVFKAAFQSRGAPYSGVSDFPVLLENVMNKSLLAAYALTPDVWRTFVKVMTVRDFRDVNMFRTGTFGALDALDENGEYKLKGIPDGVKTAINTETKGNRINVSRKLLINDDMQALADLMTKLGRAAALSIEKSFFDLLAQNAGAGPTFTDRFGTAAFFHASRGNIGTASAPSVAAFDADRVLMRNYKDISGNEYLDIRPSLLLINTGHYGAARVINTSQFDHTAGQANLNKPNAVGGMFTSIIDSPRLGTPSTKRYMFVDPAIVPAFVCAFLEGAGEAPYMEAQDGWSVDGAEMKLRLDYKVQPFDPFGAFYNAGA